MKQGTENTLKFKLLQRMLNLPLWQAKGLLQSLWDLTAQSAPRGDIGRFTYDEIAAGLDWRGDPQALIDALVETRWIDQHDEHGLIIHDWPDHCESSVHRRLVRAGQRFADGTAPSTSRCPASEKDPDETAVRTATEKKARRAHAVHPSVTVTVTDSVTDSISNAVTDSVTVPSPEPRARRDGPETASYEFREIIERMQQEQSSEAMAARICAITGDPDNIRDWYRYHIDRLYEAGGGCDVFEIVQSLENAANPGTRAAKGVGEFTRNGGGNAAVKRITALCKARGVRVVPWKKQEATP